MKLPNIDPANLTLLFTAIAIVLIPLTGYLAKRGLESTNEAIKKVENKVDKINGNVRSNQDRIIILETRSDAHLDACKALRLTVDALADRVSAINVRCAYYHGDDDR